VLLIPAYDGFARFEIDAIATEDMGHFGGRLSALEGHFLGICFPALL